MASSSIHNKSSKADYGLLQQHIDRVIGQIGLEKTICLLTHFIDDTHIPVHQTQRLKMVSQFLVTTCIGVFELQDKAFFTSAISEYREARMACYHLLKKYTEASYSKIAEEFGLTKRNVLYNHSKCEERLSVPFYYADFNKRYDLVEDSIIQFISKLHITT